MSSLIGNERNKQILKRLIARDRLGASYLFAGPDGVGKRLFALAMAKAVNCERNRENTGNQRGDQGCDSCPACRRIDAGSHPDVQTVAPDGVYIRIAQARALAEEIQYRPREGRHRFFIIDQAERLRDEAANALLKTLEEPPPTTTLILLSARPDALLPTIRSRVQRLNFAPLTVAEMQRYLENNYSRPATDTALLARLTEGRIGQATAIDISDYRRERRGMIELLELLATGNDRFRLLKAAEYYGKQERDAFEKKLDMLLRLLRDIFLIAAGRSKDDIINNDEYDRLAALASRIGAARLTGWIEKFDVLRANLAININRPIALEALLLNIDG
ncbi:MAG: DNA polymerase III subunit delta' [Acidobacteria bacterium]|nr:DNA polymerase III subunit delta' [Acidobacteriota bacterium]